MSSASAVPFQPLKGDDPAEIGGYRLAAVLGTGGMGKVYLSYTPGGRPVALKVIRSEFGEDPEFRRRFQQEVRSAQRVQGLFTAPVIDYDTESAQPWLATAYVPGPSLAHAVSSFGALPTRSVLLLTVGVAEALLVIHRAGIVHRDLKPANVLLASDGPRVIDFGIARAADATALTGSGVTIGTPAFMAPEQAAAGTVSPATDIFALGQIAAFAAVGTPVYGDGPSHAVLYRIVHEEPDLSGLPDELRPLVTRCLSRSPEQRPGLNEIIELCDAISPEPLRQGEDWLPEAVAVALTARQQLPAPVKTRPQGGYTPTEHAAPTPPPGGPAPHVQPGSGPAYAPTQAAPSTPPPPPGPHYPPHQAPAPWGPAPAPRQGKKRGGLIAGVVAGAVAAAVVVGALLNDGSDQDESKPPGGATPTGTAGANASPGGARPDPKPAVYRGIDLPGTYYVRLVDTPPRPAKGDGTQGDLFFQPRVINVVEADEVGAKDARLVLLDAGRKGTLDVCRTETRYAESIPLDRLTEGSQFCVLSDAGHIAVATYRGASGEDDPSRYISLDLTVWRNAQDPVDSD